MAESAHEVLHELTLAGLLSSDEVTQFDKEIEVGVNALLERLVSDGRITQYQADKFLAGQASDICFGDYIVLEELGRGGMGTVLLARHRRMDREVAIKVLPTTALDSESAVARFYQEVKVAAKLTHPNIVHAYDAGEHHGFHYLVMEYVPGHDLARVLEQLGALPVTLALDYVMQAAAGLDYAHRKGIVHRDIKPSNLLLDDEGTVKVLDMGLARIGGGLGHEASMHLTTTGQVMGTVEYMSPEQAEDTRAADQRSDIYSLGCTLYRLVTGVSPFARETVVKTILAHREAPVPVMVAGADPGASFLNPIFQKMVAKNPADRYPNLTVMIEDMRRLHEQLSSSMNEMTMYPGSSPSVPESPTMAPGSTNQVTGGPTEEAIDAELSGRPLAGHMPVASTPGMASAAAAMGSYSNTAPTTHFPPPSAPGIPYGSSNPDMMYVKHHRGNSILMMGILSVVTYLCFVGVILGIITWVFANSDLKEMESGLRDSTGRTLTKTGRMLAIIALGLFVLTFIVSPILSKL